eukprot:CAMPEP_0119012824 /NCGR_PEP_ID=MMETSP1176-20130426/7645_1 /TAXON_ID=265551 /ORGANISM="Synedropsis recta cf, Strain CCMP1620" /LENGTH=477 /DNA_ID=CAMNT_0006965855 /DNA_START=95 /DNA_END=1528 /DNA_ORIENTATION=+
MPSSGISIRGDSMSTSKHQSNRKLGKKSKDSSGDGDDVDYELDHRINYSGNPLSPSDNAAHYTPGEFDDLSHIWIGWPRYQFSAKLRPTADVVLEMIEALCTCRGEEGCTKIVVQVPSDIQADAKTQIEAANLASCVDSYDTNHRDDLWIRDYGPVFTKNNTNDETILVEFNFDFWGAPALATNDFVRMENPLDALMYANNGELNGFTVVGTHLIGEGGNREFNGKGTLMMNREVETQRNLKQSWNLERSEDEYKRLFGVSNIVWIDGISTLDRLGEYPIEAYNENGDVVYVYNWGTGGHIDEVARFISADTILVAQVPEEEVEADTTGLAATEKKILDSVYKQLEGAVDEEGDPFGVIALPSSPIHILELSEDDDTYYWFEPLKSFQDTLGEGGAVYHVGATSYMNFVITNKVVLIPKYYVEGDAVFGSEEIYKADASVKGIFETLMPDRTIVAINPLSINFGGGGMHCITAHQVA